MGSVGTQEVPWELSTFNCPMNVASNVCFEAGLAVFTLVRGTIHRVLALDSDQITAIPRALVGYITPALCWNPMHMWVSD